MTKRLRNENHLSDVLAWLSAATFVACGILFLIVAL